MKEFIYDEAKSTAGRLRKLREDPSIRELDIEQECTFNQFSDCYEARTKLTLHLNNEESSVEIFPGFAAMSIKDRNNGWCAAQWASTASIGRAVALTGRVDGDIATIEEMEATAKVSRIEHSAPQVEHSAGLISQATRGVMEEFSKRKTQDRIEGEMQIIPAPGSDENVPRIIERIIVEKPIIMRPQIHTLDTLKKLSRDDLKQLCKETLPDIYNPYFYPGRHTLNKVAGFYLAWQRSTNGEQDLKDFAYNYVMNHIQKINIDQGHDPLLGVPKSISDHFQITPDRLEGEIFREDKSKPVIYDPKTAKNKGYDMEFLADIRDLDQNELARNFKVYYPVIEYLERIGLKASKQQDILERMVANNMIPLYKKILDLFAKGTRRDIELFCSTCLDEVEKESQK
jgi:hypothetical protein